MKVAKTFVRLGHRFKPGDDAPADLDKETLAHYLRLGMLVEALADLAERKQRGAKGSSVAAAKALAQQRGASFPLTGAGTLKPQETKPAGPDEPQFAPGSQEAADRLLDSGSATGDGGPSLPLGALDTAK